MNILTFSEKRAALAFSDYLRSQGIPNRVQPDSEGFSVVLERPEDAERAVIEAQGFVSHPDDPKYWQASWETGRVQKDSVYGAAADAPPMLAGWWQKAGWVTRGVALLCALIFAGLLIVDSPLRDNPLFEALKFPPGISIEAIGGQWWRLLTPAFMHGSALHIIFNLLWWWELGSLVERFHSSWRLLALTLVIALVCNAVQFLAYGQNFLGLSGVVYGLLGYLWLYPVADPGAPYRLRRGIVIFMLGWLALGYTGIFDAIFGISIANHGHLAGLICGGALGLLLGLVNYRRPAAHGED